MLANFFVNTQKTGGASAVKPLRLTVVEEDQTYYESLKTWEGVIKVTIERVSRLLPRMSSHDVKAQLLKLEQTSEDSTVNRLGGPQATVSALYLYLNTPNCNGSYIVLAIHLELASFLARLTRHTTTGIPVGADLHQISDLLGCSIASAVAELYCTIPQHLPPVIIIDTTQTIIQLARTEMSGAKYNCQFLVGTVGITTGKSYFEGTFALCCPSSLPEEFRADSNSELLGKRTALRVPAFNDPLPRRF